MNIETPSSLPAFIACALPAAQSSKGPSVPPPRPSPTTTAAMSAKP